MFIKVNMKKYENIITLNMNDTKTHLILVSRLFCTSILHKIHLINHFFLLKTIKIISCQQLFFYFVIFTLRKMFTLDFLFD